MKTITTTITAYSFDDLTETAKENVKQWYVNRDFYLDDFKEDYEIQLKEYLPNSDLKIALSWLCCQGDGVNVYGRINLEDFLPHWDATEKEKRTIRFYLSKSVYYYDFTCNNRYSYSCKNLDIDALPYTVEDFVDTLPYDLRDINVNLITRFYTDMFDFFSELDAGIYQDLHNYIYNPDEIDIADYCDANEIYFTKDGEPI